jgi:hypothetical protein
MKLKIVIDDDETRAIWETVQRAEAEVARWPAWKRGEHAENPAATDAPSPSRRVTAGSNIDG